MLEHAVEILLVEDNPNDVELTLRALKKNNITNRIHVVRDGAEALEFIFSTDKYKDRNINEHPKVILLDLNLPKVNGLEVLKRIKDDERTRSIPVVMMTSSREEQDLVKSYKLGVNSYIVKPVDFSQFTNVVKQLGYYWMLINQNPNL